MTDELEDPRLDMDVKAIQQILMRVSWAARKRLGMDLESYGMTAPQYMTLRALQNLSDACTMTELAEAAHQVGATMTGIIDRLAERGLVERRRDPQDRRAMRVSLTSAGLSLLEKLDTLHTARMYRVCKRLTPDERQEMLRLMTLVLETTLE